MIRSFDPPIRPQPVGRYAPSPTGLLHLGNARTALLAYQDCRRLGGTFVLRMEDTDRPRTAPGAAEAILEDLRWLGIDWDEGPDMGGPAGPYVQSGRSEIYLSALRQLAAAGLIYPCTCSRKDLQSLASAPHGSEGPLYPGTCRCTLGPLDLSQYLQQVEDSIRNRRTHHQLPFSLRFNVQHLPPVAYIEEELGPQQELLAESSGDFVVFRRDALWAYQFVCAADDAFMGITRVVRGEDLRNSTGKQVALISALGYPAPTYRHVALAADSSGHRMSKRDGSDSIRSLREQGVSAAEAQEICLHLPLVKPPT